MIAMQFIGANPGTQAVGVDKLAGVSNYLIGNDPSGGTPAWRTMARSSTRTFTRAST